MFKSTTLRAALALPVLSALLIAVSAGAITAHAATVASSVHYQQKLILTCANTNCSKDFPAPGPKHQLNLTRMTCFIQGPNGSTFALGGMELVNANNTVLLPVYLPVGFSSSAGTHSLNQAIDIQVASSQHVSVVLSLVSDTASAAACTATGTLDTLQ